MAHSEITEVAVINKCAVSFLYSFSVILGSVYRVNLLMTSSVSYSTTSTERQNNNPSYTKQTSLYDQFS